MKSSRRPGSRRTEPRRQIPTGVRGRVLIDVGEVKHQVVMFYDRTLPELVVLLEALDALRRACDQATAEAAGSA